MLCRGTSGTWGGAQGSRGARTCCSMSRYCSRGTCSRCWSLTRASQVLPLVASTCSSRPSPRGATLSRTAVCGNGDRNPAPRSATRVITEHRGPSAMSTLVAAPPVAAVASSSSERRKMPATRDNGAPALPAGDRVMYSIGGAVRRR